MTEIRRFRVFSRSSNTTNFGLRGHLIMDTTGQAYELGLNHLNEKPVGYEFEMDVDPYNGPSHFASMIATKLSGELPRALSEIAPPEVVREVFGT